MSVQLRRNLFASSILVGALVAGAAHAQTAARPATAVVEEVIVTAGRVESALSKTPIAVTAVTGADLTSEGITNPTQLSDMVPNLSIVRGNGLQITIRGVTSTDGTEKGDPSASFLLNGLYIARPQAQEVAFYDIERVEVLRGPQGTLYGRNTTAGVINVLTATPKFDFSSSFDLTVGNYDTLQATGVVNMPLSDSFAVRIAANYDARENYVKQAVPQIFTTPKAKDVASIRVSALYRPTDNFQFKAVFDASKIQDYQVGPATGNFFVVPFAAPPAGLAGPNPVYVDRGPDTQLTKIYADAHQGSNDDDTWGVLGEATYNLTDNWDVTWLGGYREFHRDDRGSTYFGSATSPTGAVLSSAVYPNFFRGDYSQNSQEVRVAYASDKLKAQLGAYYFREEYDIAFFIRDFISTTPGTRGYFFGFPQGGYAKTTGVFGQATYSLTDAFRLTAGVRTTSDDKERIGATSFRGALTDPTNFAAGDSLNNAAQQTSKVTWKVGADFDLTDATLLYGTVSTGYKAGGFNDGCLAGQPGCNAPRPAEALFYQPETITAYEVGAKTRLMDGRLRLSTSYFHYDYQNLQLSQLTNACGAPCQVTTNAAKALVDGIELESVLAIDENNRLDFSATWLDARYEDWPVLPTYNLAGAKLDRSPEWAFNAGYSYTQPLANGASLIAGIRTRYSAKYAFFTQTLRAQFWQPSFTKTDLSLTYDSGAQWSVQGYVRNVENTIELTAAGVGGGFPGLNNGGAGISEPRTYGVRLNASF